MMGTSSIVEFIGSLVLQGEQVLSSFGIDVSSCFAMLPLIFFCSCSGTGRLSLLPADGVICSAVAWEEIARVASVLHPGLDSLPTAVLELEGISSCTAGVCFWTVVGLLGESISWRAPYSGCSFGW